MIDTLAQLIPWNEATRFALILTRVLGLLLFCPIFSSQILPRRVRIVLALTLTAILLPIAPGGALVPGGIVDLGAAVARELAVGLALGLVARVLFDAVEGAARLVAGQSGFALSSMVDPLTGSSSVTPALFQALLATTLALAADLHHLFIGGLVRSYELIPSANAWPRVSGLDGMVSLMGARLFGLAVELAGPALVVTFAVDLVLVLVGRALPQVPVLIVGYPLKVAGGILAMGILAYGTGSALRWVGRTFSSDGAALLSAFGGA